MTPSPKSPEFAIPVVFFFLAAASIGLGDFTTAVLTNVQRTLNSRRALIISRGPRHDLTADRSRRVAVGHRREPWR
ncbi:hypothetical protein CYLTODRAFT_292533 [Cylindrobasidium torrendii FP15055 ss-10]|uniref:Uncharacterized protein n=1 Tax=Cylindrobasidium torrendii FP15055 ss-10 TaxID=1314674 RepID=A0A0D7BD59_9AGAR|nr:hypothetical protein CYLTODRAFT_292533 [Cylindrobasidium torrendii FP15055 ss-10]